jgi:multidrug efflux pump subunit AcrB
VFVPTAFIPGVTGQLYKQFAVAVSVSMLISALNALTLSPALCSLILRRRKAPTGLMAWLHNGIERSRSGYVRAITPLARRSLIALLLVGVFVAAAGGITRIVPTGFLPEEDQGAFMAEIQLPDAASTNRTIDAVRQVESVIAGRPWLQSVFTVSGYSLLDGIALPNRALAIVTLKPFNERKTASLSVYAALHDLNVAFSQLSVAQVFAFNLPPIMGLGNASGFEFQVTSLTGADPTEIAGVARAMMIASLGVPQLAGVFTTYSAATPQIFLRSSASGRRRWASTSPISSTRCRRRWAAPTSTTSTASGGLGRSRSRRRPRTASRWRTSSGCACAPLPAS